MSYFTRKKICVWADLGTPNEHCDTCLFVPFRHFRPLVSTRCAPYTLKPGGDKALDGPEPIG